MRLIDCYQKMIGYTLILTEKTDQPHPSFETVRDDLDRFLLEGRNLARTNKYADKDFDQGRFAVSAWIDEIIMLSNWEGRNEWAGNQLQRRLYNTGNAGDEFFDRLEALEPEDNDVREVYITCLSLGFMGRYFLESEWEKLEKIKSGNLELLWGFDGFEKSFPDETIFPEAYQEGLVERGVTKMWSRFDPISFAFMVLPPVLLITLFLLYRFLLNWDIYDFLRSSV